MKDPKGSFQKLEPIIPQVWEPCDCHKWYPPEICEHEVVTKMGKYWTSHLPHTLHQVRLQVLRAVMCSYLARQGLPLTSLSWKSHHD